MIFCNKIGGMLITAFSCALGLQMDAIPPADASRKGGQGVTVSAASSQQDERHRQLMVELKNGSSMSLFAIKGLTIHDAHRIYNSIQQAILVTDMVEEKIDEQNFRTQRH